MPVVRRPLAAGTGITAEPLSTALPVQARDLHLVRVGTESLIPVNVAPLSSRQPPGDTHGDHATLTQSTPTSDPAEPGDLARFTLTSHGRSAGRSAW